MLLARCRCGVLSPHAWNGSHEDRTHSGVNIRVAQDFGDRIEIYVQLGNLGMSKLH